MRRAAAILTVAALAILPFAGARPTAHAATTCTKHTKRVVKHVKRHGKRRRVVRLQHHWTCDEIAAPSTPTASPPPSVAPTPVVQPPTTAPDPGPAPEPEPEANAIGVAADDHGGVKSYTLSRQTVHPGRLTVQLQNKGEDPHDMDIQRVGPQGEPLGEVVEVPVTEPGAQQTASLTVEAGEYRMWCNLYHHAEEGMEATVEVR